MKAFNSTWTEIGKIDPLLFKAQGLNNVKITWKVKPPAPASLANVRVIVTPNDKRLPPRETTGHPAPAVVVVESVDANGFVISAFNPDTVDGEAGFDFLAVAENPGKPRPAPEIRFGIAQPRVLSVGGTLGDWAAWSQMFSSALPTAKDDQLIRLLTAHNIGETGLLSIFWGIDAQKDANFGATATLQNFTVAGVGVTSEKFNPDPHQGMAFAARSADAISDKVGFNWAALALLPPDVTGGVVQSTASKWMVDSNLVMPRYYKVDPNPDAWQYREVQFSQAFNEPPAVFVTGFSDPSLIATNLPPYAPAVVGVVFNPTRFGFTIGGRNVEGRDGQTGFFWVAIGCGTGCG